MDTGEPSGNFKKEQKGIKFRNIMFALVIVFFFFFFSIWVFFHEHSRFTGQQGKGEGYLFNSSLPLPPASQTLRH